MAASGRDDHEPTAVERWRILCAEDLTFAGIPLGQILVDADFEVSCVRRDQGLAQAVGALPQMPDLLIVSLKSDAEASLQALRELRSAPRARSIPVLGIAAFRPWNFDIGLLRSHGIVGLVDREDPNALLERLWQLLRPNGVRRVSERVECLFPVLIESLHGRREEYALNLSATGMRMTSTELLNLNEEIAVTFRLPLVSHEEIGTRAKVTNRRPLRNSWGRYDVGVAFLPPLEVRARAIVEREVARLLEIPTLSPNTSVPSRVK